MAVKYSIYSINGSIALQPIGGVASLHGYSDIRIGATAVIDTFTLFIRENPFFTGLYSEFGSDAIDTPFNSASDFLTSIGTLMGGNSAEALQNRIVVNQDNVNSVLGGVIDSSVEYFIDGVLDLGTTQITVPITGMTIRGYSFDISGLTSSENNYEIFISETAIIGSGNLLMTDLYLSVTGTASKVYNLYDYNSNNAIEVNKVNYIDCTSLGDLHNYRQGLELNSGRFGGSPSLTLHGTWLGGFRISTSIVRNMSDTTTAPLFCAGTNFVMNSRFLTDMNVDLGDLQPLLDFSTANFPNPSTLELTNMLLTRGGLIDSEDINITPNITNADLPSLWVGNHGVNNTFVGGNSRVTTEIETVISTQAVPVVLLGTQLAGDLQHFDSPSNGQLRFLGTNPIEYTVSWDFVLEGSPNDTYRIDLCRNRDAVKSIIHSQTRVVNNLQGGGQNARDVAYFTGSTHETLYQNDFTYWEVTNLSDDANCTLEFDSDWIIDHR